MRPWTSKVYDILTDQVLGSSGKLKVEMPYDKASS
jgi:hypothetical protein